MNLTENLRGKLKIRVMGKRLNERQKPGVHYKQIYCQTSSGNMEKILTIRRLIIEILINILPLIIDKGINNLYDLLKSKLKQKFLD